MATQKLSKRGLQARSQDGFHELPRRYHAPGTDIDETGTEGINQQSLSLRIPDIRQTSIDVEALAVRLGFIYSGDVISILRRAQGMTTEKPNLTKELALLLALSTLWGASYSFIKIGVETIPPVTLIAARTLHRRDDLGRHHPLARPEFAEGCDHLAAVSVSGLPQQRDPLHAHCLGATDH